MVRAWGPVTNPTARALATWLCALWGRHEGAEGRHLFPVCGASGAGRSPTPDRPSFGACGPGPLPIDCGRGGCGRGDPSPTPLRALLRADFARCGGGTRAPGGGSSCLCVGRPGSGALPAPTASSLAPPLSPAFCASWPRVPWALALRVRSYPPPFLFWCPAFSAPPPVVLFCSFPPYPSRFFSVVRSPSCTLSAVLCVAAFGAPGLGACPPPPPIFFPPPFFVFFFFPLFSSFGCCPVPAPLLSRLFRCFRPWLPWALALCFRPPPSAVSLSPFFLTVFSVFVFLLVFFLGSSLFCPLAFPWFRALLVLLASGPPGWIPFSLSVCGRAPGLCAACRGCRLRRFLLVPPCCFVRTGWCCLLLPVVAECSLLGLAGSVLPCGALLYVLLCSVVGVPVCCSLLPSVVRGAFLWSVFCAPVVCPRLFVAGSGCLLAVLFRSRWLVLCVVACCCRLFVAGSGYLLLFSSACVVLVAPAWPLGLLPCCVLWFVVVSCSPVLCPVFWGAVLPCGAVLWRAVVRFPLLVVLVCVLPRFCAVPCCAALRVVRCQFGLRCRWCLVLWCVVVCCGVSLGVLWCGGAALVCRGVLLCRAVSCGAVSPCGAVLLGSAVCFALLRVFDFPLTKKKNHFSVFENKNKMK